jgi:hypothetical protein
VTISKARRIATEGNYSRIQILCCGLLLLGVIALQLPKAVPSVAGEVCSSYSGSCEVGETETPSGEDGHWLVYSWNTTLVPETASALATGQPPAAIIQRAALSQLPRAPPV